MRSYCRGRLTHVLGDWRNRFMFVTSRCPCSAHLMRHSSPASPPSTNAVNVNGKTLLLQLPVIVYISCGSLISSLRPPWVALNDMKCLLPLCTASQKKCFWSKDFKFCLHALHVCTQAFATSVRAKQGSWKLSIKAWQTCQQTEGQRNFCTERHSMETNTWRDELMPHSVYLQNWDCNFLDKWAGIFQPMLYTRCWSYLTATALRIHCFPLLLANL